MLENNIPKSTPKDVFMHLMVFVALYVSVVSLIALLFQYINYLYPDPLNYYYTSILNSIRWSASVLVVMFPVYIFMSFLINKDLGQNPAKREIKIRKWLTYLTLFASALTVIIDVITLIYNFLGGELTLSFFLKILAVLIVAAAVFGYYIWELRQGATAAKSTRRTMAWIASALVLIVLVGGFIVVGSPANQRAQKFDEQRIADLQTIQNEIQSYWSQKGSLPQNLDQLTSSVTGFTAPKDPEHRVDYEYFVKSDLSFQLCASFNRPSAESNVRAVPMLYPNVKAQNWSHEAGRVCFDRTLDPQRDKLVPPIK